MEPLLVICPQVEENPRLAAVLSYALEGRPHVRVQRPDELHPVTGQRVLFAVSLVFLHKTAYEGASHGNYTVTTQDKTDEITAPTRVVTLVNVNTATAEELETLTGIGPSLAQTIIDYRAEHGDFTAAEDLLNVKGIGEAKLEGFRAEITFTEEDGNENSGG